MQDDPRDPSEMMTLKCSIVLLQARIDVMESALSDCPRSVGPLDPQAFREYLKLNMWERLDEILASYSDQDPQFAALLKKTIELRRALQ
jgi:hypothetical protein